MKKTIILVLGILTISSQSIVLVEGLTGFFKIDIQILENIKLYAFGIFAILVLFYLSYIVFTQNVPHDKKRLWAWTLLTTGWVTAPFFWYFYMFKPNQSPKFDKQKVHAP